MFFLLYEHTFRVSSSLLDSDQFWFIVGRTATTKRSDHTIYPVSSPQGLGFQLCKEFAMQN